MFRTTRLRSTTGALLDATVQMVRTPLYRAYYRAIAINHDRRLYAPKKSVPGGSYRSYELFPRHGYDIVPVAEGWVCTPSEDASGGGDPESAS